MVIIKLFTEAKERFALAVMFNFPSQHPADGPDHPLSGADRPSCAPQGVPAEAPELDRLLLTFPAIDAQMERVKEQCHAAIAYAIGQTIARARKLHRLHSFSWKLGNFTVLPRKPIRVGSLQDSLILQEANASFVQTMCALVPLVPLLGSATRAFACMMGRRAEARTYFTALCDSADCPEESPHPSRCQPSPVMERPVPGRREAKRLSLASSSSSVGPDQSEFGDESGDFCLDIFGTIYLSLPSPPTYPSIFHPPTYAYP